MFVFSASIFDRKYLSLEIRRCFRDSVDMNVNHGKVKVCILSGVEGAPGRAGIPCFKDAWGKTYMDPAPKLQNPGAGPGV